MADDPMNRFLRGPVPPASRADQARLPASSRSPELVVNRAESREPYKAFATTDRVASLRIHTGKSGMVHAISYGYLIDVSYNEITCDLLHLSAGSVSALIRGRNLYPIFDAITLHACAFVQAFYPERFALPEDGRVPVIETIDVQVLHPGAPDSKIQGSGR
jgi:hypothetical protein